MVVDGGITKNDFIMQHQADVSQLKVIRKHESEVTALGAAIGAGIQAGMWTLENARIQLS